MRSTGEKRLERLTWRAASTKPERFLLMAFMTTNRLDVGIALVAALVLLRGANGVVRLPEPCCELADLLRVW